MADLQTLIVAVDELSSSDLETLYQHIIARRHQGWVVPAENIAQIEEIMRPVHEEAAGMTEMEINDAIDDAIQEVRREREGKSHF